MKEISSNGKDSSYNPDIPSLDLSKTKDNLVIAPHSSFKEELVQIHEINKNNKKYGEIYEKSMSNRKIKQLDGKILNELV